MRVMVTGSAGFVGSHVCRALRAAGHDVIAVDRTAGRDIRDPLPREFDVVVHSAAVMDDGANLRDVNVAGTANVLAAASEKRVVFLSSVDVLGVFKGERAPDYLPLDAAHPCYASSAYGRSKHEAEELCRAHGAPCVILRPPGVWDEATYVRIQAKRDERASFEWDPFWEYGAFLDVRDLAEACVASLTCSLTDHETLLVSAPDITTSGKTSREWAECIHPEVEWRGDDRYEAEPYRTLLDIEPAKRILNWKPRYAWRRTI